MKLASENQLEPSQGTVLRPGDLRNSTPTYSTAGMIRDFKEIIKPRISTMVLLTVWAGSVLTPVQSAEAMGWLHAMIGTLLVAASGSAVNQYLERYSDFLMPRTKNRPLPSGSLSAPTVVTFAAVSLGAGMGYMLLTVHWVSTGICFATWVLYGYVYTMTKPKTPWNTAIGAIPGATPVLIGACANDGSVGPLAWILFWVLCLWQIPHFMAIAWKYRQEYADGGLKMLTVIEPTGLHAGYAAVGCSVLIMLVSFLGYFWVSSGIVYLAITGVIGLAYLWFSIKFLQDRNLITAKHLLRISLLHLPIQMVALIACR